jgi:hypothetical protein
MDCPGFEKMIDYLDGRLGATEGRLIERHVGSGCVQCGSIGHWYRRVKAIAARDDSVEPPGWVFKRAVKAFLAHRDSYSVEVPEQMAILVFDSLYRPEIAGMRSTSVADRQLLYSAGGYSVDLQIARAGISAVNLMGQILKEGEQGFESVSGLPLQIAKDGATAATTLTDAVGEFTIHGIISGEYDFHFEGRERRILIPGVPLSTTLSA